MAEPAIAIDGLTKRYGDRTVVDGVTLDVRRGEIVALLGPNGAGKTTTVEIVEGYRRADGGTVRVLGVHPWRARRAHRARVGLMLQGGGIDPRGRPDETLHQYAAFHADPLDPDALLDELGLRAVAASPFHRLSGGERQRLGFALALVGRPDVLVLDEPTAGMDPQARAVVRARIEAERARGAAILVTTHELGAPSDWPTASRSSSGGGSRRPGQRRSSPRARPRDFGSASMDRSTRRRSRPWARRWARPCARQAAPADTSSRTSRRLPP